MKKILLIIILCLVVVIACKSVNSSNSKVVTLNLESKSGSNVTGTATFTEKNGFVTLEATIKGLKPGVHGIHIHEKADCSANDATSAGGHWNPTFKKHGKWTDAEHHLGDIGNFTTDNFGTGKVYFKTDEWAIGGLDKIKDILGKGLIIHENPDDFTTQPTGNAGARVACAGIIK